MPSILGINKDGILKNILSDIRSGLIVFLVALPLCLAISLASGTPASSGLIAGVIGGLVVGFLSKSKFSVSGPAAGLATVILSIMAAYNSLTILCYALLIAGILQFLAGLCKWGGFVSKIDHSVIEGMLVSIGLMIIVKQFPIAFRADHQLITILSVVTLLIYSIFQYFKLDRLRFFKFIPLSLLIVVFHTVLSFYLLNDAKDFINLSHQAHEGSLINMINFIEPSLWSEHFFFILKSGFVIFLIASIETLVSLKATDKMSGLKSETDPNQELIAQGIGNMTCAFLGGIPITSVIIRSSVNIESGANSKLSSIAHGLFLLIGVVFFAKYIELIPIYSLAIILIIAGYNLAHPHKLIRMLKGDKKDTMIFIFVILMIMTFNILVGVIAGSLLSYLLHKKSQPCLG